MIRPALAGDLVAINDIYNHWVRTSTATYQIDPVIPDERRDWFAGHDAGHPILVAELEGAIAGWGSLSKFRDRAAYDRTVEDSVYLAPDLIGRGLGSALLAALLERGAALGHRTVIAGISAEQDVSLALHRKFGFVEAARLRQVGFKFDRWLDLVYMQKLLSAG